MKASIFLLLSSAILMTGAAQAQTNQLDIGVRSAVMDKPLARPFGSAKMLEAPEHGKIYGILAVQLIPEEETIVKPVDARKLMDLVCHELDTHGFHQVEKGRKPEILLTVQYGRAWLNNPYFGDAQAAADNAPGAAGGMGGKINAAKPMQMQDLSMANPKLFMRLQENGVEAKAQKAQFEKLCIKLTAWQYPTDPQARAKQLWTTIMIVDDPDHRDLNAIAAEMLAAGAPYFDKEIKEEEVDVFKPLPDGRVNVGTPEVIDPSQPRIR